MALLFSPRGQKMKEETQDPRLAQAKEAYLAGKIRIVTTSHMPNREVQGTFGLIVSRSYIFDNAFYGLVAQALEVNADCILAYSESVAFHPEGDKYYSCIGTAVRLKAPK